MIRILIADDHAVVRRGLKQIVSQEGDMTVIGEACDSQVLLALVRTQPCDIVVMDISMPGRSGLEVLKDLKQEHPRLPVLILSVHPEDQYAVRSLKLGASGYLTKECAPEELVQAIRKVLMGGRYVSASLAEKLASDLIADSERPAHETLSDREHQILCMIASGKSVTEIANELTLSDKTVSTYRTRVLEKMKLRNNAELTHYAIASRLVG
jgi:two-component system, NarL family, invasion response regulator UvrY